MDTSMNIVRLQIKNFLSISDVDVKPGHITQIVGANNQGKTSILKAIEVALKGSTDPNVVKIGETQAEIIVEFSDGMNVRRRIKSDGTQDVRVSKNEMEAKAPQSLLNSLFESSAFNPLELLEPKRRTEALLQVIPAKVTQEQVESALSPLPIPLPPISYDQHGLTVIKQLHEYFYLRRAEANKASNAEHNRLKVEKEKVSEVEPVKGTHEDQELDQMMGACDAEIRQLQQKQGEHREKDRLLKELQEGIRSDEQSLSNLERQIADIRVLIERRKNQESEIQRAILEVGTVQPRIDELNGFKMRHVEEKSKNATHRLWLSQKNNIDGQLKRAEQAFNFASDLDRCVEALRTTVKNSMMSSTEMPIPGITYDGEKFFFEGSAVENLSTSASMKLACGLARSLAKKTKVICLDGAEALDEDNYKILKQEISNDGFTYFITKVGEAFRDSAGDTVLRMNSGAAEQAVLQ